jgi:hypothetical protein
MANKLYKFACDVSQGRLVACKDSVGGISAIYLQTYDTELLSEIQLSNNEITDLDAITLYKYDLRPNTGSFTSTFTGDPATGTSFYEQTLEVTFQKIVKEDLYQLNKILQGRVQIFVLDANDNVFLLGTRWGCDVSAGALTTGTAKSELSGFTLTFTGQEVENYIVAKSGGLPGSTSYPFDQIGSPENVTITAGTTPV